MNMQKHVNRFLCLSEHDRKWVLHRLSPEQRKKLKLVVGGSVESVSAINVNDESLPVWRTEALNQFECGHVLRVLDSMPYRLLMVLFQYEGKPALDYFVKNSIRQDLISRVSSLTKMDIPERYGAMAAEFLVKRIRDLA
jgi:hypothetical protein